MVPRSKAWQREQMKFLLQVEAEVKTHNAPPVILKIKMQISLVFSITGFKTAEVIRPYTYTLFARSVISIGPKIHIHNRFCLWKYPKKLKKLNLYVYPNLEQLSRIAQVILYKMNILE